MPRQPTPTRIVAQFWTAVSELLPLHPGLEEQPEILTFWQQTVKLAQSELMVANRRYSRLSRNQLTLTLRLFRGQDPFFKKKLAESFYRRYSFGYERRQIVARLNELAQAQVPQPSTQGD